MTGVCCAADGACGSWFWMSQGENGYYSIITIIITTTLLLNRRIGVGRNGCERFFFLLVVKISK